MAKNRALHAIFFFSGISGLIYQVIWVRQFANVFGNTVYSAAAVTAVFMSGLGVGGFFGGRWADRAYRKRRSLPLALYGRLELAIALLSGALALLFPHLEGLSAAISSYTPGAHGWLEISLGSSIARCTIAVALLAPVTALMGATLTLLIRHVVGADVEHAGYHVGLLYATNTAGAALGCLLTDLALVPALGLGATQAVAVLLNLLAALGATRLARTLSARHDDAGAPEAAPSPARDEPIGNSRSVLAVAAALFLTGFVGMGLEIVWFRHLMSILGPFRFVFSLMLAVILVGLWAGSVLAGLLDRRFGRPLAFLAAAQALLVVVTLLTLASLSRQSFADSLERAHAWSYWPRLKPILQCCAVPSVLMGAAFPLANAHAQRVASLVGARAGLLYLANTAGAVVGSLACGLVLLPAIGAQRTVFVVMASSVASLVPLMLSTASITKGAGRVRQTLLVCGAIGIAALTVWVRAPADLLLRQVVFAPDAQSRVLAASEGIGETIGIIEDPSQSQRVLYTNGHAMSGTAVGNQRYMRLFAHMPLLLMDKPRDVAVICFGVGNTLSAVALHDEVERADLIDVSKNVLDHASWFSSTNHDVLASPKVHVHINDGRQHLRMKPPASYDLITLEPPPLAQAGVAALYSRDFYELARSRLRPGGMISQWLPLKQLTPELSAAVVRAFVEVFPSSVLLNGMAPEMILLGRNGAGPLTVDPVQIFDKLAVRPAVRDELHAILVDDLADLLGTYAASAATMNRVTERIAPVTDDLPSMEYQAPGPPADILNIFFVRDAPAWCRTCFDGSPVPDRAGQLAGYLEVMEQLYDSGVFWSPKIVKLSLGPNGQDAIAHSRYLRQGLEAR